MAGGPEEQGAAGLMRHSKSRCPPAGSDRGTRFPFRIKRVFPFFPAWPTESFLNWTWRSSIISVEKLAKEETVEKSPLGQRRLPAPIPARGRVRRRPGKHAPTSPATGRRILPSEHRRGRLYSGRLFSSRYLLGEGRGGGLGPQHTQRSTGTLFSEPIWAPQLIPPPPPRPFPVCPLTAFSKHSCGTCFRLQPAAFAMRANCLTRCLPRAVTTLSSRSRLHQVPPHPFLYPTGRLPSAPRTIAARRERARRGRPHRWSPGPRRKGRPGEPQCRQKPRLTVGRFWVPSTRGHQKPSESCSAHAKEAASSFKV
ncbi:uncharacterized protein LOC123380209 [Felis catus]|uniref:uncharacterized protein LOC123380209 n=1 Tax=Felis catus TaxID=9685 RepID=UPI001D1A277F|nr:uncharacterized protein LOC123380209 [Felis catus]XP_044893948.1 uncharacterized protein LOC123380209 [Felis catus]